MNQCCKFNVLWWKSKKTGTFSVRAWLQNVCGGGLRGECPWQCRCGWRYWQDEGLLPPIEKDAGGRWIQRTEIGRYRTPKARCEFTVVLRPDESPKEFSVLPLRCIVERSFSWLENFRRIAIDHEFYSDTGEAMVQLAFCRLMYNKSCDWNLNSFLLWHALSVLSFALKLYAL